MKGVGIIILGLALLGLIFVAAPWIKKKAEKIGVKAGQASISGY